MGDLRVNDVARSGEEADELARLADDLVDEIAAARRHYAELRAAIDRSEAAAEAYRGEPADELVVDDDEDDPDHGYRRTPEEEAEIVALGLALNGGSREEAHAHIVETLGIYDTDEILERTFGASAAHDAPSNSGRRRFGRLRRS